MTTKVLNPLDAERPELATTLLPGLLEVAGPMADVFCAEATQNPAHTVAVSKLTRIHHHVSTDHVRNETADLLKIPNVIARQFGIRLG